MNDSEQNTKHEASNIAPHMPRMQHVSFSLAAFALAGSIAPYERPCVSISVGEMKNEHGFIMKNPFPFAGATIAAWLDSRDRVWHIRWWYG